MSLYATNESKNLLLFTLICHKYVEADAPNTMIPKTDHFITHMKNTHMFHNTHSAIPDKTRIYTLTTQSIIFVIILMIESVFLIS